MGFLDGFLNKMNFSTTDEYDGDYDDMDMTEENEEEEEETAASAAEEKKADQETPKTESAPASSTATFRKKAAKKYLKQSGFYEWCYETVRSMYDHSKGVQRY